MQSRDQGQKQTRQNQRARCKSHSAERGRVSAAGSLCSRVANRAKRQKHEQPNECIEARTRSVGRGWLTGLPALCTREVLRKKTACSPSSSSQLPSRCSLASTVRAIEKAGSLMECELDRRKSATGRVRLSALSDVNVITPHAAAR
jgi:hypothetical protein